ncbi:unnamed protein product [Plutella xylostella]|uniref:(diamondback moth) hypothetical protein n=1 Tax=Plutella xylostella TaxID=51655 RepID=A0A8S4DRM2_PLUXY|nr:unnamed protein product [Plutella xylostella]
MKKLTKNDQNYPSLKSIEKSRTVTTSSSSSAMSERAGRRGAGAPFYLPPRRQTSAEIISEARAAVYGGTSHLVPLHGLHVDVDKRHHEYGAMIGVPRIIIRVYRRRYLTRVAGRWRHSTIYLPQQSPRHHQRCQSAPFYLPPRRQTSAEIISDARAAVYGDTSSASSVTGVAGAAGLRPLRTRRPFTPRDAQRTLFTDRAEPRPPSAFK